MPPFFILPVLVPTFFELPIVVQWLIIGAFLAVIVWLMFFAAPHGRGPHSSR